MSLILGVLVACSGVALIFLSGGSVGSLLSYKAIAFVLIGIIAVTLITSPGSSLFKRFARVAKTLRKPTKSEILIEKILTLVQTARREGILSLENQENTVSDSYVKKGLELITGSCERETIHEILQKDSDFESSEEKLAQDFIERIAILSPGIGMLGTLVEIVQMLYTYKGPETLAPGIANALLPVVYSGLIAYLILMPLVSRIKVGAEKHRLQRDLAIQGILAIQSGEPPYIVKARLQRYTSKKSTDLEIPTDHSDDKEII